MNNYMCLKDRDFIYQVSNEDVLKNLVEKPDGKSFYIGIDPTADSLHVGHLSGLMVAKMLSKFGLKPIIVIGGGTALIGDPSGKSEMRTLIGKGLIDKNIFGIKKQVDKIFKDEDYLFINNYDWLKDLDMISYLRDLGKHFSVNRMLSQDCVKNRMQSGITYLEFSYMILQAYDFVYLNKKYNCELQIGGADQWGNMVMGIDLCRRLNQSSVECFTFPLITNSNGEKMGKTEKGALWLDENKTGVFDYYQYWMNVSDEDVLKLIKRYTYISSEDLVEYKTYKGQELNKVKEALAFNACLIVHGEKKTIEAKQASRALFSKNKSLDDVIGVDYDLKDGVMLIDVLSELNLASSKSEARRLINGGGIYFNELRICDVNFKINKSDINENNFLLRVGKKKFLKVNIN